MYDIFITRKGILNDINITKRDSHKQTKRAIRFCRIFLIVLILIFLHMDGNDNTLAYHMPGFTS